MKKRENMEGRNKGKRSRIKRKGRQKKIRALLVRRNVSLNHKIEVFSRYLLSRIKTFLSRFHQTLTAAESTLQLQPIPLLEF